MIIAAVSLIVMAEQLVWPAVYSCMREDTQYYLNWVLQFSGSLSEGIAYPRWMPDSHGGYGNPTFVFYAPLVIYLTSALKLATGSVFLSISMIKLAGLFLSGLFMYLFIKDIWGAAAGVTAAVVYTVIPFRVFDLYILGFFASKFAYVWFPLILYLTRNAVREGRFGPWSAGATTLDRIVWTLTDHQGTVRDVARNNAGTPPS